ncbi:uncharacterized protein [Mytilus edulis]|uniref:uncharacterized protein n=1 Tax=Mytilus edulis TaxID=6550 RepID=UPI0039EF125B
MSEIIYDIIPNTRYYVRVLSKNKIGESNTTTVITLGLSINKYDVEAILLVLLVDIAVVLVKAVWEVVLVVLLVVIAITVLTASFHLRRKANNASVVDNPYVYLIDTSKFVFLNTCYMLRVYYFYHMKSII